MSSDEVFLGVEVFIAHAVTCHVVDVDFVSEEAANATESFAELETIGGLVCDELNINSILLVVHADPVS